MRAATSSQLFKGKVSPPECPVVTMAGKQGGLARKGGTCGLGSSRLCTQTQVHLPSPPSVAPVPAYCQSSPSTHVHISAQVHTQKTFTVSRWALGTPHSLSQVLLPSHFLHSRIRGIFFTPLASAAMCAMLRRYLKPQPSANLPFVLGASHIFKPEICALSLTPSLTWHIR